MSVNTNIDIESKSDGGKLNNSLGELGIQHAYLHASLHRQSQIDSLV